MNDRKLKVLAAVVDEYIRTGEPVSSKTVSSLIDVKASPATIRNDMSVLEQLGLLTQPHTSAGRVPTFAGFKVYIQEVIPSHNCELPEEEKERLDDLLSKGDGTEEYLIQSASATLARVTNCAAVATSNPFRYSVISKVEVIPAGRRIYVVLLVTSDGGIKNQACRLKIDLTESQLEAFTGYMTENLQGVSINEYSDEVIKNAATALGAYMAALSPLIEGISAILHDINSDTVTMSGEENLYSYDDIQKGDIVKFVSKKNELKKLLDDAFSGINVVFGDEGTFAIGNSSMITTHYKKGDKTAGSLGIIGPMRIDYGRVIPYLEYFSQKLTDLITEKSEDDSDS